MHTSLNREEPKICMNLKILVVQNWILLGTIDFEIVNGMMN